MLIISQNDNIAWYPNNATRRRNWHKLLTFPLLRWDHDGLPVFADNNGDADWLVLLLSPERPKRKCRIHDQESEVFP